MRLCALYLVVTVLSRQVLREKGYGEGQALRHFHNLNYPVAYLCILCTYTKVFFEGTLRDLTIKLYELRERGQKQGIWWKLDLLQRGS